MRHVHDIARAARAVARRRPADMGMAPVWLGAAKHHWISFDHSLVADGDGQIVGQSSKQLLR